MQNKNMESLVKKAGKEVPLKVLNIKNFISSIVSVCIGVFLKNIFYIMFLVQKN